MCVFASGCVCVRACARVELNPEIRRTNPEITVNISKVIVFREYIEVLGRCACVCVCARSCACVLVRVFACVCCYLLLASDD